MSLSSAEGLSNDLSSSMLFMSSLNLWTGERHTGRERDKEGEGEGGEGKDGEIREGGEGKEGVGGEREVQRERGERRANRKKEIRGRWNEK